MRADVVSSGIVGYNTTKLLANDYTMFGVQFENVQGGGVKFGDLTGNFYGGLVSREVPYGESEKSSKKSLYRVCDPFCRFWFKVIASRRSVLDSAPAAIRKSIWQAQSNALFAEGWEDLARAFVAKSPQLMALAGDGDYWRPAGRWWQGTAHELDVVSFNGAGTRTLMGEVRWSHRAFLRREVESLAKAFASIPVPPGFPQDVTRVLFLSSVARDVPRQVEGLEVLTAADVLPTTRPARA